MKLSYRWLCEWIEWPQARPWPAAEVGARLTMAGLELESLEQGGDADGGEAILQFGITPNRGDAMSVRGIARELAVLAGQPLRGPDIEPQPARIEDRFPVTLGAPEGCPRFVGRVIRGVNQHASSPQWLRERLQSCGVRSISPVVDVTNYTMLELGTPMHAYDLSRLQGGIEVRFARQGEPLRLLDGRDVELDASALVIADARGAVGIAGVMGGEHTSVSEQTTDVFFELAWFRPEIVGACARRMGLITDAAQRFERGVDFDALGQAMERATALLLQIAGGQAGPVTVVENTEYLPVRPVIRLRRKQLARLVGARIPDERVGQILQSLGLQVRGTAEGWEAIAPSWRFDLNIEADLIEEVARHYGYDAVPEIDARIDQTVDAQPEARLAPARAMDILAARGYQEAITYSFADPQLHRQLFPEASLAALSNPISADLSIMRLSLWPGLLHAARDNLRRQQSRVRLAEYGNKYPFADGRIDEIATLAGVAVGDVVEEQWSDKRRPADFYDVKADVEAVLEATGCRSEFRFVPDSLPCLHPGRSARIHRGEEPVGWIGELHPGLVKALDLTYAPVLFELETGAALRGRVPAFAEISKFPHIRRDIAVVVPEEVAFAAIEEQVRTAAGAALGELIVFDVYRGAGIDPGFKSVALGLILQDRSRTLVDEDADRIVEATVQRLRRELNASIRDQ